MKEIRETKMVEQTTVKFVAEDGKVFDDEMVCKAHEKTVNKECAELVMAQLGVVSCKMPFVDWETGYDHFVYSVELNCEYDFLLFKDAMMKLNEWADFEVEKPKEYPCKKLIYTTEGWIGEITNFKYHYDQCAQATKFKKFLEKNGYEVQDTKSAEQV